MSRVLLTPDTTRHQDQVQSAKLLESNCSGGGGGGGPVSWSVQNVTLQNSLTTLRHAGEQLDKIGVNCF